MDKNEFNNNQITESEAYLKSITQKVDFKTPTGYFDSIQGKVHGRIHQSAPKNAWNFQWKLAGVALTVVVIGAVLFNTADNSTELELTGADYYAYLEEHIDEFSTNTLINGLTDEEISAMDSAVDQVVTNEVFALQTDTTKTKEVKPATDQKEVEVNLDELSDEEIYDYLLDEGYADGDWDDI